MKWVQKTVAYIIFCCSLFLKWPSGSENWIDYALQSLAHTYGQSVPNTLSFFMLFSPHSPWCSLPYFSLFLEQPTQMYLVHDLGDSKLLMCIYPRKMYSLFCVCVCMFLIYLTGIMLLVMFCLLLFLLLILMLLCVH